MNQRIAKLIKRVCQSKREEKVYKRIYTRLPHTMKCAGKRELLAMYEMQKPYLKDGAIV